MKIDKNFDLIVIGGGTGGLRAAYKSALLGYRVALIDSGVLGGTCLNSGCIPTKAMLRASELYFGVKSLSEFGIEVKEVKINFRKLMNRVFGIVSFGRDHAEKSVMTKNLTVIREKASFVGSQAISVGSKIISGKKIIIATGSVSKKLFVKGSEKVFCMDFFDVLKLKNLPKSIGIIGGGYIAMEFATFFSQLGVKVIVIEAEKMILPFVDLEISKLLLKIYEKRGIEFKLKSQVLELGNENGLKKIILKNSSGKKSYVFVEEILVAIGRAPNTKGLNLGLANVSTNSAGAVEVNDFLQTTNKNIYAIGDVVGKAPFAHAAKRGALVALENALMGKKEKMPFSKVAWAVFTSPPISGVGKNETELKEEKIRYGILRAKFSDAGMANIIGKTEGILKVFYDKKTDEILGANIFGVRADDLIHEFVVLMNCGGTVKKLREIIHVHPTISEVIGALR